MPEFSLVAVRLGASAAAFLVAYGFGWISVLALVLTSQMRGQDVDLSLFSGYVLLLGAAAFIVALCAVGLGVVWRARLGVMLGTAAVVLYGLRAFIGSGDFGRVLRFTHFFLHIGLIVFSAVIVGGLAYRGLKGAFYD